MRIQLVLFVVLLLCNCGAPQPPVCHVLPFGSRAPASSILENARKQWEILGDSSKKSEWPAAETAYNDAVKILFDKIRCGPGDWSSRASNIGTALSAPSPTNANLAKVDALFPATAVKIHSKDRCHIEPGIGVPAVAWTATTPVGVPREKFYPPNGQPRNITVILDFSTPVPQWHFPKRWVKNDFQVGENSQHLAADWTAPVDFFWFMCDLDDLRIQNVIIPERFTEETGLYFLQPYDPEKIPVVMVHGLVSSPDAYRDILNDLSAESWFREKYQVWLYNYPTGTPWLYNALRFRQIMGEAGNYARRRGPDENLKKMVILSHSMGGLLTRTAVSEPGTKLYHAHFKTPFKDLKIKPETRLLIKEGLLYEPLTDPKRVVFMAVPHRGSPMANFRGTAFLSNLIRLPKTLTVGLLDATLQSAADSIQADTSETSAVKPPTAISTLSPKSLGFQGLNQMPLPKGITFHSIMGDKGHGDKERSSDGVVPYWSSHVEPVASELIVDSNHSVPNNQQASDEVKRILRLHLKEENMLTE
ncbi:esterase/lipase family protein [Luteolibacter algae]|uniref:Esterase/lipase family protein n=1 Tax=Luteolibacter algae TaxID=454151 RepID=A0ABW5DFA4_9BACT